ncbi:MAG: T9SS type A sorting domain-containing protein [Bacteroidota bacterium]
MTNKFTFQRKIPLMLGIILLTCLPFVIQAQSVKRQCISSYGSVVLTDNLTIGQTVGQCYNTSGYSEDKTAILQGFQQPNTFSIEDISSQSLRNLNLTVYPNPASYSITIKSEDVIEQSYIHVVDINGKHVLSEKVQNLLLHRIDCESWVNGVYLITIYDSVQNSKTLRLIISK